MTRLTGQHRPDRLRVAGRAVFTVAALSATMALSGCATTSSEEPPDFMLTSADVVLPPGSTFSVSLPFIAATNNVVWDQTVGFGLPGSDVGSARSLEIVPGQRSGGSQYGSVTFDVEFSVTAATTLDTIELVYVDRAPTRAAVGTWTMRSAGTQEFLWESGGYVAAQCSPLTLAMPPHASALVSVTVDVPGIETLETSLDPSRDEIQVSISCDPKYALYIVTPQITYLDSDGEQVQAWAAPITLYLLEPLPAGAA